jgi:hypothetical protein
MAAEMVLTMLTGPGGPAASVRIPQEFDAGETMGRHGTR